MSHEEFTSSCDMPASFLTAHHSAAIRSTYSFFSLRSHIPVHRKREGRVSAEAHFPVWVPDGEAPASYPDRGILHRPVPFFPHGSGRRNPHWEHSRTTRGLCPDSRSPGHRRHCSGSRSHYPGSIPSGFLFRSSIKVTVNINSSYAHLLYDTICKEDEKVPASSSRQHQRFFPRREVLT